MKFEDVKINDKLVLNEEVMKETKKLFSLGWVDYMREQKEIIVTDIDGDMLVVNGNQDYGISEESIKYFNKIECDALRIEDLKVGDELECINRDGFLNERRNAEYLLHNKMVVSDMNEHEIYLRCDSDEKSCRNYIYIHELKYFKKKEPVKEYDFNDLIDVARKGFKDGVISYYGQSVSAVNIEAKREQRVFNSHFIKDGIEFINSLYKETFVIECEKDIRRLSKGAKLTLKNGELITFSSSSDEAIQTHYFNDGEFNVIIPLVALKGAKVEQSR